MVVPGCAAPAKEPGPEKEYAMKQQSILVLAVSGLLAGCAARMPAPVVFAAPTRTIDYLKEVKPLLDRRCVVCHSCYNSPCQLKLDAFEGVDRGATKKAIYDSSRLRSMDPTRLFTDAHSTEAWRQKKFFSVTSSKASGGSNDSIMIELLSHKMKNPRSAGEYRPEAGDLTCAENQSELGGYLAKHPNRGMPFGFPALKQEEFELLAGWLVQGARGPSAAEQERLTSPEAADLPAIRQWEAFLNRDDAKHAMTARYLYEHLFLAHLKFGTATNDFFELVRSRTAPGEPLDLVATVRPYDDPGPSRVFYRFRKIHSTIVVKTHMVFVLDDAKLRRFDELFIQPAWLQPPHQVGYDPIRSANPFVAFEQIPPLSRYRFLLDNALYVMMTFIHGPVCKGQIALNVLDDHFWVMFLDPEHDLSVAYPAFLRLHSEKLRLPVDKGSDYGIFAALTDKYRKAAVEYYKARQDFYTSHHYGGLGYESIWKGAVASDAPALTVYRHFDSASVHRGLLGNLPKTMWVVDYPLFERIYYALVAGFDVYGTVGHQLALRHYMDALRVEGESSFLDFMPPSQRQEIMQSWYKGVDLAKIHYEPSALPARIAFATAEPNREFIEEAVSKVFAPVAKIGFDPVNYLRAGEAPPGSPGHPGSPQDYLRAFRAISRPGSAFLKAIDDANANLAYLRIRLRSGKDVAASIVVNRWHDNVAHLFGEDGRLDASKDTVDFIAGLIGSYPNYFFDVREEDLPDFFDLLAHFEKGPRDAGRLARYGVNRADERLWAAYDWFQKRFSEDEPVDGGLFDLNRYYHDAR
jgi:hypothetical protein